MPTNFLLFGPRLVNSPTFLLKPSDMFSVCKIRLSFEQIQQFFKQIYPCLRKKTANMAIQS